MSRYDISVKQNFKKISFHWLYNKNQYQDMIIKLLGKRLKPSTSVKYLGIHIDNNLLNQLTNS